MMMFGSLLFCQDKCVPEAKLYNSQCPTLLSRGDCDKVLAKNHDGVCQSAVLPGRVRA